jgi:predicted regulator of Ras-like GTPase activity (Roadblock/LC7/MglB family)
MSAIAVSKAQGDILNQMLSALISESEARAAVLCDIDGNILAQTPASPDLNVQTAAVLAAGTFVATRELAGVIGEAGFQSSCHRGANSGVLVSALGDNHLLLLILSSRTVEGLARICLEKVSALLISMLKNIGGQSITDAGQHNDFEVEEKA